MKTYTITPESFLSRIERQQLMKCCKEHSEIDLIRGRITWPTRFMLVDLALFSGLRVGEIAALKIQDIYLNGESYLIIRHGKGDKTRTVYIDNELSKHLKQYINYKVKVLGQSVNSEDPLFSGQGNNHCQTNTLQKSFKAACKVSSLHPNLHIHAARHTYAAYLLQACNNLKYVSKQLGHSDISMTSLYSHILPEDNTRLANSISRD
jgi:integrase